MTEVRDPDGPGVTTISDRAVARIAAQAATGIEEVHGLDRGVLDPRRGVRRPRTEVSVEGRMVRARVALAVTYPTPVRQAARQVRERVREQVERMTGLTVGQVDVEVAALDDARTDSRRTVR